MTETQEARETAAVYAEQVRLGVVLSRENLARFIESQAVRLAEAEEALREPCAECGHIDYREWDGTSASDALRAIAGFHVNPDDDPAYCFAEVRKIARAGLAASWKEQSK